MAADVDTGHDSDVTDGATVAAAQLSGPLGLLARELRQLPSLDGLGVTATLVLVHLADGVAVTSADLARVEQITPQSMSAVLAALESRGLVARRLDPGDARRHPFALTEAGRRRRGSPDERLVAALVAGFDEVELELLAEAAPLLERLARSLRVQ